MSEPGTEGGRKVPALIVAGFLGSGKTTLVDHLLRSAVRDGVKLAIVSNEFGNTGIDRALLDSGSDGLVELDGGCVCCKLSDALPETLSALFARTSPDRLVLECSGLALPGDLVIQFWRPPLQDMISEERVVVVVEAARAAREPEPDSPEAETEDLWREQLEAADIVLINKADRVAPELLERAAQRTAEITAGRPSYPTTYGRIDPSLLFGGPSREGDDHRAHEHEDHDHGHDRFVTSELRFEGVCDPDALIAQIAALDALRAKGFVRTPGGIQLLQGVGKQIELTPPARPVPEHLIGLVVVIGLEEEA